MKLQRHIMGLLKQRYSIQSCSTEVRRSFNTCDIEGLELSWQNRNKNYQKSLIIHDLIQDCYFIYINQRTPNVPIKSIIFTVLIISSYRDKLNASWQKLDFEINILNLLDATNYFTIFIITIPIKYSSYLPCSNINKSVKQRAALSKTNTIL